MPSIITDIRVTAKTGAVIEQVLRPPKTVRLQGPEQRERARDASFSDSLLFRPCYKVYISLSIGTILKS
jgi:hypothetical protein